MNFRVCLSAAQWNALLAHGHALPVGQFDSVVIESDGERFPEPHIPFHLTVMETPTIIRQQVRVNDFQDHQDYRRRHFR